MPDPARLLTTLQRAVDAFRATPGRRGRVVDLQGAAEVLVAGDLHGNLDNFRRLLQIADLARNPARQLVLQEAIHGPHRYPAGGDRSHQLLDLIAALKCQYPRQVHFLIGNHELAQATGRRIAKDEVELNDLFIQGVRTAYGDRADDVYTAYRGLIAAAPLALRTPNRIFLSHSLPPMSLLAAFDPAALEREEPTEADCLPGGAVHALVWGRDMRPATVAAFLQKMDADLLITGHIPCDRGFDAPNDRQLILDSLGHPAAYCLFPADRPLTHPELLNCIGLL
jgi:hypothetical protein